jgi:hypothetical protein
MSKWVVKISGSPDETGSEFAVVRDTNKQGLNSDGWFGPNKIYVSGDPHLAISPELWNSLAKLTQQTADILNAQDSCAVLVQNEKEITRQACIYCENFRCAEELVDPTDSRQPHLLGICKNCPYPDANDKPDPNGSIWVNLVTGNTWVDGSSEVVNCPNFIPNPEIFGHPEPVKIFDEIPLPIV